MKNRIVKGKRLGIILAVALAALLLFAACGTATTEAEKTVQLGALWPLTGGAAAQTQVHLIADQDYLTYFNEQGAIPGVSIKLTWGDTAMQLAQFYSLYERFKASGIPLIFAMETVPLESFKDRFAKDQVVVMTDSIGFAPVDYSPGWCYAIGPTQAEEFACVAEYFKENWKESRPPRFAFITLDGEWGRSLLPESTKYAQSLGFEVLPTEFVPYVVLDASTQLLRLREEGADLVYIQGLASSTGPTMRDAQRLGLLDQIQFAGTRIGMDESVIEMAGAASEGFLTPGMFPWMDETDVPGVKMMVDQQMKYHGKVVMSTSSYPPGWIEMVVVCEAIKRAIENVGYENLDGAAIKEALDNMQDFDVYGLASVTYKDRPLDHRGSTKEAVYEIRGGKPVRVSDWREVPSLVPEGLVRE